MSPGTRPVGGGWMVVRSPNPEHRLSLRIHERDDGRLRIVEILLYDGAGISGAMLRDLPLGAWEAQMNAPEMAALLRERLADDGPYALSDLESEHDSVWMDELPADADDGALEFHFSTSDLKSFVAVAVEPQLDVGADQLPPGKRPDAFYRAVADAYSWLGGHMRHPAVELAEINHVPTSTVHRWIKEARRRGLLGPGRRLVIYEPTSPEAKEWAQRVRSGTVSEWDLAHEPLLRAWASRLRRGALTWSEAVFDPIYQAAWSRYIDNDLPYEIKNVDPFVRLVADSPAPFRDPEGDRGTDDQSNRQVDADQETT